MFDLSGMPRSTPKVLYKHLHRQMRIAGRMAAEALEDLVIYGACFTRFDETGIYNIPPEEWAKLNV